MTSRLRTGVNEWCTGLDVVIPFFTLLVFRCSLLQSRQALTSSPITVPRNPAGKGRLAQEPQRERQPNQLHTNSSIALSHPTRPAVGSSSSSAAALPSISAARLTSSAAGAIRRPVDSQEVDKCSGRNGGLTADDRPPAGEPLLHPHHAAARSAAATAAIEAKAAAAMMTLPLRRRRHCDATSAIAAEAAAASVDAGEASEYPPAPGQKTAAAAAEVEAASALAEAASALAVRAAAADACPAKLTVLSLEAAARCPVVWQNPLSLG